MEKVAFIVAGVQSGSGKTTLALGLMAALKRRGLKVQPFKVGPDFIDPGHHTHITGRKSRNLDGWMLSKSYNTRLFSRLMRDADCAVVEGVMGLYDGFDALSESGSTAQMAKWLDLPVLLVVDAASMARSAAAVVKGFETFDKSLNLAGVVFNRLGSKSHLAILREAISHYCAIPCFGGLPRDERLVMPERHLGLVTSDENTLSMGDEDYLAEFVESHLDLDNLLNACVISTPESLPNPPTRPVAHVRIAVARDAAFCFYYPDNLESLEHFGAKLIPFSPLKDKRVPTGCHGIYLGGGYPEVFAESLAQNEAMRISIREAGTRGCPIYAECGGLMFLGKEIVDLTGARFPMAGVFPFSSRVLRRFRALGYREVRLREDGPLGTKGTAARGHEFHYSDISGKETEILKRAYEVTGRRGKQGAVEGYRIHNTLASYIHLHFGSNPEVAKNWIAFCVRCNTLSG